MIRVSVFICLVLCRFRIKIKIKNCEIFHHILQHSQHKFVPRASRFSCIFLAIACTLDVILPDFPDVFQIWPTLAVNTQQLMEKANCYLKNYGWFRSYESRIANNCFMINSNKLSSRLNLPVFRQFHDITIWTSVSGCRKRLPNLVWACWLWRISRAISVGRD